MDEIVNRVAAAAGIEADTAQQAIVAILAFLRKEGPPAEVDQLFAAIPGASAAVETPPAGGGGLAGMLGGMGGGLMALAGQLTGLGLGMGEMQSVGHELFAYGREKVGEDAMGAIIGAVPGLSQFV